MKESVLYMPVSAEWFKLIKDGVKRVEYREIKALWVARLFLFKKIWPDGVVHYLRISKNSAINYANPDKFFRDNLKSDVSRGIIVPRYTHIEFTSGYPKKDDTERRARYKLVNIAVGFPQKGLCPDEFLKNEYLCIEFKEL